MQKCGKILRGRAPPVTPAVPTPLPVFARPDEGDWRRRHRADQRCKNVQIKKFFYIGAGLRRRRVRVQIAAATPSSNSLRQTVHTHRASVHQAAKLVAAILRVATVTAGLVESNGSLPPGL